MPWSAPGPGAPPNAGFSSGTPWIALNPNHPQINAEQAVADPGSVFHYYRRLIALRRTHQVIVHGRHELLVPDHPQLYAYLRRLVHADGRVERLLVLCNFGATPVELDLPAELAGTSAELLIGNLADVADDALNRRPLRGWEARVLRLLA
jgi:oligo-1,6-glucosidase